MVCRVKSGTVQQSRAFLQTVKHGLNLLTPIKLSYGYVIK